MPFVVGVRWSFRGKDAGSADSPAIGATEDAASGRAAQPDGTTAFRQTLLVNSAFLVDSDYRVEQGILLAFVGDIS